MQRYNCLLRVGGSPYNEVRLFDLTAPEIIVLRTIHRDDSVLDLRKSVAKPVHQSVIRDHLEKKYSQALGKLKPKQSIQTLFGPAHMLMPELLPELEKKKVEAPVPMGAVPDLADQEKPTRRQRRLKAAKEAPAEDFDEIEKAA